MKTLWALMPVVALGCLPPPPPPSTGEDAAGAKSQTDESSPFGPGGTLQGPIAKVDGVYAPNTGKPFEIRPGCQVVRTNTTHTDDRHDVTVTVQMKPLDFAIYVEPGHRYVIVREFSNDSGPTINVRTYAREEDAEGNVLSEFGPVFDPGALESCRAEG